jgi:hypothetical protein
MIGLSSYLADAGIVRAKACIVLHTPKQRLLAQMMPWIAENRRDLLEAYQATHNTPATTTLRSKENAVVFVGLGDGTLVLAGVWRIMACEKRPMKDILAETPIRELQDDYQVHFPSADVSPTWDWFTMNLTDQLGALRGRLRIAPKMTPTYVRLAESFPDAILSIERESLLTAAMPDWKALTVEASQLRNGATAMPAKWQEKLREWRGIYLIVDVTDGARYVGAAYANKANFLGRWAAHVKGEKGITKWLDERNPRNFRFSILERVLDDATISDITPLEQTWMTRLGTRHSEGWGGLNN